MRDVLRRRGRWRLGAAAAVVAALVLTVGVTAGSTTTTVVTTPAELCALTTQYVQGSTRYHRLNRGQRAAVDVLGKGACVILDKIVPRLSQKQKTAYLTAYKAAIQGLARAGWLTQAQADELRAAADQLGNPDIDGDGSPNAEDCAPTDPAIFPGAADRPDLAFADTNCDGIDGDAATAVFVAPSGNDANPGTQAAPVQTIGVAISLASASSADVYAAAGSYAESVQAASGVGVYGGYAAADWTRSIANVTQISGSPQGLLADGDTDVTLQQLSIGGTRGDGATAYGIRAINGSALTLERVAVTAGPGAAGAAGGDGLGGSAGSTGGNGGAGDNDVILEDGTGGAGGAGGTGGGFAGGAGGRGGNTGQNSGLAGQQGFVQQPGQGGAGGAGGPAPSGSNCGHADGGAGGNGAAGTAGAAGAGGSNSLAGAGTDYDPTAGNGAAGADGAAGNGGGGGGGGSGQRNNQNPFSGCLAIGGKGSGGGGGGSGGGPGQHGVGGQAGGGSFGLYLVGSTVAVSAGSTIASSDGGAGGAGGSGGAGGAGGQGGAGDQCCGDVGQGGHGGAGGSGGAGGAGGGGAGGPSVAILRAGGATATVSADSTATAGAGGTGGASSGGSASAGSTGLSAADLAV
jgi:hypothetical protein